MKGVVIYIEGGGDTAQQKAELRTGLDMLLHAQKKAAHANKLSLKLVPSGGRQAAFQAFCAALERSNDDTPVVLLVDSETELDPETRDEAVDSQARVKHLTQSEGWNLKGVDPRQVHLMVQCMEAWIVSDPDALARHYGKNFHANRLPARPNLEEEPKAELYKKLAAATRDSKKGEYAKIKHAARLLALLDAGKVGHRCPRFTTFTKWLTAAIDNA